MCGIAGYVEPRGASIPDIEKMTDALRHRGPDDFGVYLDRSVALGHRRLSIIDLTSGHQPMSNEDGTLWITFNGEIYNYQEIRKGLRGGPPLRTTSDTEVLLRLYEDKGEACLRDLRGMFAFAIYDRRTRKLFVARDHLGQKPLYYVHEGDRFAFASEIKALLALDPGLRELDPDALYEYLTLRIITPPRSMYRKIRKLAPAHYLTFQDGEIAIHRYWDLSYEPKLPGSFEDVLEELDEQVLSAVRYHLVSDVPVGAFLSGGVDSSLVVAMMSRLVEGKVKTFTGDVAYGTHSELPHARIVSAACGTESHELPIVPNLARDLPRVLWHLDEPSDALATCMHAIAALARREVKVVLGGDGGDELFGGYDRYYGNVYADYYALLPQFLRRRVFDGLKRFLPESSWYRGLSHRLKWLHQISFYDGGERYAKSLSYFYFSEGYRRQLCTDRFLRTVELFDPEASVKHYFDSARASDVIDRMLYSDSMARMPDHPIMILDRMTMAHGLEARSPFLDHRLAEFCASIPSRFKVRGRRLRHIQVELARRYLPPAVFGKEKQGFASALTYLLADQFRDLYRTLLREASLVRDGYLNASALRSLVGEHLDGKVDHGQRLWLICSSELWYRMSIENSSSELIEEILEGHGRPH